MIKRIWSGILAVLSCLVEWNEIATDFLADWLSRFARRISLAAVLVVGGGVTYKLATAARNSAGTMVAINGPFAAPNVISSAAINARFADIENELTNSVDKGGRTVMTAPLPLSNGTVSLPSLTFGSDTDTGLYRVGADNPAVTVGGAKIQEWTSNGLRVANGVVATPSLSFINDTGSGLYRNAASDLRFAVAGADKTYWNATGFGIGKAAAFPLDISYTNGAGGTAETGIQLANTATTNSTQIRFVGARDWSLLAQGSAGSPASGFTLTDNTAGKVVFGFTSTDGVYNNAAGFKHQRFGASCTTSGAAGNTCGSTYSWTTAFGSANYTVACTGVIQSGVPILTYGTKLAASIQVDVQAATAVVAQFAGVDCIAFLD